MAEVFRARRIGINDFSRGVAIKRMLGGYASSSRFQEMFATEARITSQLVHPNIVSVLDFDRDADGSLCLVMELVDGCDLSRLAKTGLLPFEAVNYLIVEALKGLGHAHRFTREGISGVVHRDVSPHNVLLSWHGEVKVSDFGLAKVWSGEAATATAGLKGKPAYMSPEQANSQALDGRSDLFAVGTMMWELLVGRPLFGADDSRASLAAILFGTVPPPRQLRPEIPRDLERVALKLLQRDRNARYRTADAAIADLLACETAKANGRSLLSATLARRFNRTPPAPDSYRRTAMVRPFRRRNHARIAILVAGIATSLLLAWFLRPRASASGRPRTIQADEPVALIEAKAPAAYEPAFEYALDAKELPPSCLLMLDWWLRTAQIRTLPQEAWEHAVHSLESYHDELAQLITEGTSLRYIDQTCRRYTSSFLAHTPYDLPPTPLMDDGTDIHYPETNPISVYPRYWEQYLKKTR